MKLTHKILVFGLSLGLSQAQAYSAGEPGKSTSTIQKADSSTNQGNTATEKTQTDQTQQPAIVVAEVWTIHLDRMEKEAVTISFSKGSADLSTNDQARLRELVPAWQKDKGIDKVIVAAWSDQPYPAQESVRLPETERDLAEKRADRIEDFVEKLGVKDVDTYSMAEKPNWFQKALATDAAQIKGAASDKQIDSLNEERIKRILDSKGGPSKAVIILKRQMDQQKQAS